MLTKFGSAERLVCEPDLKPASILFWRRIKCGNGKACSIHSDRVTNLAVIQNRCGISNSQRATTFVACDT